MAKFTPPLIMHATSRSFAARAGDVAVTVLLWSGWLYLLVAAIGALWVPPFVHRMLPVDPPSSSWDGLRTAAICAVIAAGLCAFVRWRVSRHRRWFAGEDRRRSLPNPEVSDLAVEFDVSAEDLAAWRTSRRLRVHQDEHGRVVGVE
jgi:poly-beta-1,6-N-acetyl-D-glucosamine biosynthesis protein PgaD